MPFVIEKTKDPLYKEGIEVGIEKGIEKGKEEERIALVKSLLKLKVDIEIIKKATGFSKERIEKIKEEFLKKRMKNRYFAGLYYIKFGSVNTPIPYTRSRWL